MLLEYFIFLSSFILWTIALLGIGSILLNILKHYFPYDHLDNGGHLVILISGILGMASVTTIATIINFFIPISLAVSAIIMVIGLALFFIHRKEILGTLDKTEIIVLSALSLLIFAIIPYTWVCWIDTGMYHLPTIKWIVESQVPLGLANLHGRFGFNNSWFMLSACIDQWVIYLNKPYFVVNGIMTFFYVSAIALIIKRKFLSRDNEISGRQRSSIKEKGKKSKVGLSDLFLIFSSIAIVYPGLMLLTTVSPDLPSALLTLFVIYLIIYDLENFGGANFYTFIAVIISIYAITVKFSSIVLALTVLVLIFRNSIGKYFRKSKSPANSDDNHTVRAYAATIIALFLLVIPWIIRGLLLSGCMFFPLLIGYFPQLQWAVPTSLAANDMKMTTAWSRLPGPDAISSLSGWGWVQPWIERQFNVIGWTTGMPLSRHVTALDMWNSVFNWLSDNLIGSFVYPITGMCLPFFILLMGMIGTAYYVFAKKACIKDVMSSEVVQIIPLAISITGIVFWFYSAPELRFGYGFIYSFAILILSLPVLCYLRGTPKKSAKRSRENIKNRSRKVAIALILVILLYGGYIITYYSSNIWRWDADGFNFPQIQTNESITKDGTVIYTPVGNNPQFWNAPLPNSPYFNASLKTDISNSTDLPRMFWYVDKSGRPIAL